MQSTTLLQDTAPQPSSELRELTLRLYDALARANADDAAHHLSRSDELRVIGTDPDEWWSGHQRVVQLLRAQMAELGGFPLRAGPLEAYAEGSVGWVADRPVIRLPDGDVPLRLTLVCRREGGSWKVVQWHASLAVGNEESFGRELTTG